MQMPSETPIGGSDLGEIGSAVDTEYLVMVR
jgi:hypothetical protein